VKGVAEAAIYDDLVPGCYGGGIMNHVQLD
jgi:hypothetical protein